MLKKAILASLVVAVIAGSRPLLGSHTGDVPAQAAGAQGASERHGLLDLLDGDDRNDGSECNDGANVHGDRMTDDE